MSCFETLKGKGYRLTPQRAIVLDILHQAEKHITPEEIYEQARLKYPQVNKSTIYRTLELLKKLDLAAETDLGRGKLCYHHMERGHHHHLICQKCGRVYEVEEKNFNPFKELLLRQYNFLPELKHLAIFGRCFDCRKRL